MSSCKMWPLEAYARLHSLSGAASEDRASEWEYFNNSKTASLELTVTSTSQLLIHHGKTLLESISLLNSTLRGFTKGDSLLIIQALKNNSRRIRMKFSPADGKTGQDCCQNCIDILSHHFPIKLATGAPNSQQDGTTGKTVLQGEVTLSQIAEAVAWKQMSLPSVYHSCNHGDGIPGDDLNTFIKLCLSDNTFPAYVEQVEKEMGKIRSEFS